MKKNELAKKSRKLFSAILAGAMLTTSAIPESFVWAAEDVQGFGDGEDNEDVIFESVEEFVAEDAVEEGFTDGVALFSSGSEMAVGTAAANTISPGTGEVTITSGGTYTVQGGTYQPSKSGVITIDTTEKVTLEITGNINMSGDDKGCFISIENACKELTIINKDTVNVDNNSFLINNNKDATVTFEGGTYEGVTDFAIPIIGNGGVVNLKNVKFNATGSIYYYGNIVQNYWFDLKGTINIQDGTILDNGSGDVPCILGGTVNMYGGTITSSKIKGDSGITAPNIKVVGGKISNFYEAIENSGDENVSITIGNVTFENNSRDILLGKNSEKKLIIQDDFQGTASIYLFGTVEYPYIITTPGTSPEMCTRITYADGSHSISYDTTEKCLYVSDHLHLWSYSTSADKIIATCTAKPDCEFNPGKLDLTLAAADAYYSGNTYTGATVTNGIAYQTDNEADIVYYLKDGTKTNSSNSGAASEGAAPVNSGQYTVKVTLGGQTISADFEIKKMEIDPTVTMDDWTYGQKANTPSITVKSGESDITALYDASGFTCTYYTDAGCTDITTAADGAATNGGVPKNAGTYYVKAVVPENGNYAGAEAEASFTIAPLPVNLTWSKTDLIYTGSEQSVLATVANALEGDSFAIAYEGNTQTEASDSYTATVTDLGNDNYTLTGATGVSQNWSISYLQSSAAAQVSGTKGNNDWYISLVKLVPDSGYQISTDKTDWKDLLGDYTDQGEQSAGYYLKETATGAVTDKKTVTFKIDTGMPSGSIRIEENTFDSSLKNITYGYWFKDNVSVDITGTDSVSGIASVEYQAVSAEESYDANGTWNAANKLSLTESGKYVIYARITDMAGNQTIINSDGVVVFKDSVVVDSSIGYTRTTKASVDAEVMLNGNTVASVKNGETTLTAGTDYTVSADKITFSGEYLDTLAVGAYTLTVAYHPQGVTEYTGGDKPADSQITVNVSRQTASVKITGTLGKEYDGQPADLAYTTNSNANVKVEYNVNGTWQTEAPTHAGTYEVKVSVPENGDFTVASDTKTYTIKPREVVISGIVANEKVYDGTANAELDYRKAVFTGLVKGDTLTVSAEGTFADSNAAKGKTVTITNLVLGGVSADNYVLAANGQQTSTTADINPKEITVTITPNGGIYEGTITPATAILNGLVGKDDPAIILTYTGTANDGTPADGKVPSKAGTYTVTASINDSNYSLKEEGRSAKFIVEKAYPQLSISAVTDKNYGEEAFKLGVSNKGDGSKSYASSNDKVVKVDENGTVTIVGAGKATLTVSLAECANYTKDQKEVTVTVKKINHSLVVTKLTYEVTYGDPVFKIAANAEDTESGIHFTSDNENVTTVSADGTVTIKNAGTAKITVSMDESQNYLAVSKEVVVTVAPKEVTVTPGNASKIYGEKDGKLSYHAEGLADGDSLSDITLTRTEGENVGIYEITAAQKKGANPNYNVKFNKGTFTINPKEITVAITPNGGTYEGNITPAIAALNGLVGEDKPEIILIYTGKANDGTEVNGTATPVLAGIYTVTVSITDSNYNLKEEGATAEFVVTKANPGLSAAAVSDKSYGEGAFKLEVSNKGDGLKAYASSNDKVVTVDENGTVTIVGAGTATLTVSLSESANYTADRKAVTVTVAPKAITATADNLKKIVGGADPVLTYTADGLVGEDTLSGITVKRKAGEKVGTYAVTVSQKTGANPNYRITFKKGTFTIQQADQSKLKGKDVYRLKLPVFLAKGKAKKNSIVLSWKKYTGATGYDVYWRYCDGSINYKKVGTVKNGKLSITHKKLKKDREYKYFIAAYKMVEGRKIYIAKSNGVHVAMKKAATTNVASIKVNKKKVTLAVGKTFTLKCEIKAENSSKNLVFHTSSYRYYTTNSKVATVSKAGVIKAKGKGTCSIYVLANNGVYKKVKVKVK
ncbi:YDG domain-containing protein [Blautia glucerasea]|uniref:MBG domain-containing protein n=1 Tax=Blautia glucerasea TaxID=536633 RepID=UPI001D02633C|nr:MBG domain-containing protein [Blautia glucerasea]MCB5388305.1 YDG domain-containing protein [Blautia glucerasea]MCB5423339.1 YDG domain-containing protein [Blautia luti]